MAMIIYKITNLLNEKIYIGQTKQPIERRFIQHSKANSPLGQAMRECGLRLKLLSVAKVNMNLMSVKNFGLTF